ncbi:hypothetical protein BC834DRAFT_965905 [Gloeopeniophorella convolvens]|nr:hypothetical protein BC834DRAFT_965905 [Gloeopeniophorella convolvens]
MRMRPNVFENFVGPISTAKFLEEFVPEAPKKRLTPTDGDPPFELCPDGPNQIIGTINELALCPDLEFVNTADPSKAADRAVDPWGDEGNLKRTPGISVVSRAPRPEDTNASPLQPGKRNWAPLEMWIETGLEDTFFPALEDASAVGVAQARYLKFEQSADDTCAQLISHASAHHHASPRAFSFSIGFFGSICRLFRWDRSGVVYSEPFLYRNEPEALLEFLWRFNFLSPADRGRDTTVLPVGEDDAERALVALKGHHGLEKTVKADLRKFLVRGDGADSNDLRYYIAPRASWSTDALWGRGTFGYIAYDPRQDKLVYLKDFWREERPDILKEGDVYRELHAAHVRNIPALGCAGDVPAAPGPALAVQRTRAQEFQAARRPGAVQPLVHYRLVLDTVGRPLRCFESTRELCGAVRDAVVAHADAYGRTRILHRDVSAGNILIGEDGKGMLIDWHLARRMLTDPNGKPVRLPRAGTWRFMSVQLLSAPHYNSHKLSDDLESFYWVLSHHIVRYRLGSTLERRQHESTIRGIFDLGGVGRFGDVNTGGTGKHQTLQGDHLVGILGARDTPLPAPCRALVEELRSLFLGLYGPVLDEEKPSERGRGITTPTPWKTDPLYKETRKALQSSQAVLRIFEKHLGSTWDLDGDGSRALNKSGLQGSASGDELGSSTIPEEGRSMEGLQHQRRDLPNHSSLLEWAPVLGSLGTPQPSIGSTGF